VPIIPSQLGEWAVTFSDRLFLGALAGARPLGIYSLSYRLGSVEQQLASGGLKLAWDPFTVHHMNDEDAPRLLGAGATYVSLVAMVVATLLGVVATPLLLVVHAKTGYLAAAPLVFIVALAGWFELARYVLLAPTMTKIRPEWGVFVLLGTGVLNVALNYPMIKTFGMAGAAWATLIAYAIGAIAAIFVGRRLWKIAFEWYRLGLILVAGIASYEAMTFVRTSPPAEELLLRAMLASLAFLVIMTLGKFWRKQEILFVRGLLSKRKSPTDQSEPDPARPGGRDDDEESEDHAAKDTVTRLSGEHIR